MRSVALTTGVVLALLAAAPAPASQLISRNTANVRLEVSSSGIAVLSYNARGREHHVVAWGAINAVSSLSPRPQETFRLDYSGGSRRFGRQVWQGMANVCRPAHPRLAWLVTACRAPDGSLWAVQSWQRTLPIYGLHAVAGRDAWELRLSHWRGPLPQLEVHFGWTYRRYHQIFGQFTYRGQPVYGNKHTPRGVPLDEYGRNVYVDTLNSAYGPGWRRENGFLTHEPTGGFCYGFYPHGSRPSGRGDRYRATVIGPGVTPDVLWEGTPPAAYDPAFDRLADRNLLALLSGDPVCRPH